MSGIFEAALVAYLFLVRLGVPLLIALVLGVVVVRKYYHLIAELPEAQREGHNGAT